MELLKLFLSFFQIGLFSIGGGYAAMPLIQEQIVTKNSWLSVSEFADVITIAEMTPGPVALNSASFVGMKICGFIGAVVATLGYIIPSCIIVSIFAAVYAKYSSMNFMNGLMKGLRPAVIGMIASAAYTIFKLSFLSSDSGVFGINLISVFIFLIAFTGLKKFKISPITVIFASGLFGYVLYNCQAAFL